MNELIISKAIEHYQSGFNCAESTFKAIVDVKFPELNLSPRIATGFGGGMAHTGNICGALSGCILAINLLSGRDKQGVSVEKNNQIIFELIKYFEKKYGSSNCPELSKCDYSTKEGKENFALPERKQTCFGLVEESVRKTLELIDNQI